MRENWFCGVVCLAEARPTVLAEWGMGPNIGSRPTSGGRSNVGFRHFMVQVLRWRFCWRWCKRALPGGGRARPGGVCHALIPGKGRAYLGGCGFAVGCAFIAHRDASVWCAINAHPTKAIRSQHPRHHLIWRSVAVCKRLDIDDDFWIRTYKFTFTPTCACG